VVFSPGGVSAKPQYPPVYVRETPSYEPGYHNSQQGYPSPDRYPQHDDDPWPSFAVIILLIILIVLIVALFCPPIKGPTRDAIVIEVRSQFGALRTANPGIAGPLSAAETAIINRINNS
jgi:hypothetical protein